MVCMGGRGENAPAHPAMGHRIDTANTVCCAQYITPWPLTHPCCAPVFFSSSVDCDRRRRNEAFHEARRQFTSIKDILISPHCSTSSCVKAEGVGLAAPWFTGPHGWVSGLNCTNGACNAIHEHRSEHRDVFATNQKCQALYVFLQKLNNGCDFVALLRVHLEYHGWFERHTAQPLKSELSGAAKMEGELSLIAQEPNNCSQTDHVDTMLQQQHYTALRLSTKCFFRLPL